MRRSPTKQRDSKISTQHDISLDIDIAQVNTKKRLAKIQKGKENTEPLQESIRLEELPTIGEDAVLAVGDTVQFHLNDRMVTGRIDRFRELLGRNGEQRPSIFVKPAPKSTKLEKFKPAFIYKKSIYRKIDPPTSAVEAPLLIAEDGIASPPNSPNAMETEDEVQIPMETEDGGLNQEVEDDELNHDLEDHEIHMVNIKFIS